MTLSLLQAMRVFFKFFFFFAGGFTAHGSMITKQKQPCEIAVVLSSRKFFFLKSLFEILEKTLSVLKLKTRFSKLDTRSLKFKT